ncbi:hypothetical protein SAMN05518672_1011044 [Chitinophaga sp. CF118]|nr:hypothetical protein SAMN05518672_1011044 [Chitinophaga sp. CF118]
MQQDPKSYIAALQLSFPENAYKRIVRGVPTEIESVEEDSDKDKAYFDNKSIVSFVAGVSPENRQDILDSTLLAQLAAGHLYPNPQDLKLWYEKYTEVLRNIGWTIQLNEFSEVSSSGSLFEMKNAILGIVSAAFGGNYVAIVTNVLDALKSLSDSDSKIVAFEKNTHSLGKGTFQLAMVEEVNGAVALHMAGFIISTSSEVKRILFFSSKKEKATVSSNSMACALNKETYATVRNTVKQKLGDKAQQYIAEITI